MIGEILLETGLTGIFIRRCGALCHACGRHRQESGDQNELLRNKTQHLCLNPPGTFFGTAGPVRGQVLGFAAGDGAAGLANGHEESFTEYKKQYTKYGMATRVPPRLASIPSVLPHGAVPRRAARVIGSSLMFDPTHSVLRWWGA